MCRHVSKRVSLWKQSAGRFQVLLEARLGEGVLRLFEMGETDLRGERLRGMADTDLLNSRPYVFFDVFGRGLYPRAL